ncbi:RNA polymerase sigma-70 factor [Dysgonomonas massiliensis]|uniref:RNA polymerase sigma-70 factor n=1 Tax=Dysgonomonas massiliensis TaxID=2040292 RepID=UPI000C78E5BF|nr:RNA polymerase sigma-70 factor [Dysgonomonas massiliensis]
MINEGEYIQRLALGDHDAFRYVFMKYFPKMKYFIAHLVKSEAIAEELSQDVFEKIWRNRSELSDLRTLSSYLYRMSKNIAINHIEHKYVERNYVQDYKVEFDFSLEDQLDANEMKLLIMLEVEKMPEQRKRIFEMSRYENVKNEEIAEKLNISKKTVENHINLALKQIRKTLNFITAFIF